MSIDFTSYFEEFTPEEACKRIAPILDQELPALDHSAHPDILEQISQAGVLAIKTCGNNQALDIFDKIKSFFCRILISSRGEAGNVYFILGGLKDLYRDLPLRETAQDDPAENPDNPKIDFDKLERIKTIPSEVSAIVSQLIQPFDANPQDAMEARRTQAITHNAMGCAQQLVHNHVMIPSQELMDAAVAYVESSNRAGQKNEFSNAIALIIGIGINNPALLNERTIKAIKDIASTDKETIIQQRGANYLLSSVRPDLFPASERAARASWLKPGRNSK